MVLEAQVAFTPNGNCSILPMPVAPVVVCVILVSAELKHTVDVDPALTVLFGVTVMVPKAFTLPQPPVNGII